MKPVALVIDEDSKFRTAMEFALKKLGITPILLTRADDMLLIARRYRPDVILMDLISGKHGSGYDLIQVIRTEIGKNIPVIIVSERGDAKSIWAALVAGANDFILKPLDRELLTSKLARYVKSQEMIEHQAVTKELFDSRYPAKITVDVGILEVGEFQFKIVSPHLLSKGSAVRIQSRLIQEILGSDQSLLVTVSSSWMETYGTGRHLGTEVTCFGAMVDLDSADSETQRKLRRWLLSQSFIAKAAERVPYSPERSDH